mmetsp:Transcript_14935/g.45080  ORF Transcript_14935/g.45080 Transcript_14935/m.45080 type:complete len:286 (+) Transcript_14935:189-1046(+)
MTYIYTGDAIELQRLLREKDEECGRLRSDNIALKKNLSKLHREVYRLYLAQPPTAAQEEILDGLVVDQNAKGQFISERERRERSVKQVDGLVRRISSLEEALMEKQRAVDVLQRQLRMANVTENQRLATEYLREVGHGTIHPNPYAYAPSLMPWLSPRRWSACACTSRGVAVSSHPSTVARATSGAGAAGRGRTRTRRRRTRGPSWAAPAPARARSAPAGTGRDPSSRSMSSSWGSRSMSTPATGAWLRRRLGSSRSMGSGRRRLAARRRTTTRRRRRTGRARRR